jgi:capsular polysaccharide biosynthesis protein
MHPIRPLKNLLKVLLSFKYNFLTRPKPIISTKLMSTKEMVMALINSKEWIRAQEVGLNILEELDPDPDLLELLIYKLQQNDALLQSCTLAKAAIEIFPEKWVFNFYAGLTLKQLGKPEEALQYIKRALDQNPDFEQTLTLLTKVVAELNGLDEAEMVFNNHNNIYNQKNKAFIAAISSISDWAKFNGVELLDAGPIEKIIFKAPKVWGSPNDEMPLFSVSNKPYVAKIKNARIFGSSSIILVNNHIALSDTGGHHEYGQFVSFEYEKNVIAQSSGKLLMNQSKYTIETELERGIFLSGLASDAFGHWFPEFLPKLMFLQQHPEFDNTPIIIDKEIPESHIYHLKRLTNNPLLPITSNQTVLCKELLVAPSPTFFPTEIFSQTIPPHVLSGYSLNAMQFIRGGLSVEKSICRNRRVFLGRRGMQWRKLNNEIEIEASLKKLKFETILIEDLSAPEQIELFQSAEWIVAPNGSALNNLIFSDINTKIVILSQPNLHNWGSFSGPMEALGYRPIFVCGEFIDSNRNKHSDYNIPIDKIHAALYELGLNET